MKNEELATAKVRGHSRSEWLVSFWMVSEGEMYGLIKSLPRAYHHWHTRGGESQTC